MLRSPKRAPNGRFEACPKPVVTRTATLYVPLKKRLRFLFTGRAIVEVTLPEGVPAEIEVAI